MSELLEDDFSKQRVGVELHLVVN